MFDNNKSWRLASRLLLVIMQKGQIIWWQGVYGLAKSGRRHAAPSLEVALEAFGATEATGDGDKVDGRIRFEQQAAGFDQAHQANVLMHRHVNLRLELLIQRRRGDMHRLRQVRAMQVFCKLRVDRLHHGIDQVAIFSDMVGLASGGEIPP